MAPVRHPTPTSNGGQEKQTAITSKGLVQKKLLTIPTNTQVPINSKGEQELISERTRSSIDSENFPTIQEIQTLNEPIAKRKRSLSVTQEYTTPSHSRVAAQLITHVANSVLDQETGKQLNYGQLRKHPKFQKMWNKYFSNEMGKLCQGVGTVTNGIGNRLEGTNILCVIKLEDIPKDRLNDICYTSLVCEVIPGKKDPNQTRITICVTNVCYPGGVSTNTASMELFKITINGILSI